MEEKINRCKIFVQDAPEFMYAFSDCVKGRVVMSIGFKPGGIKFFARIKFACKVLFCKKDSTIVFPVEFTHTSWRFFMNKAREVEANMPD